MRKNFLITPIAMILVSGAMAAQDLTTGTLAGRVTGSNGQPLRGVLVQLNSPSLLSPRQVPTDAAGQFRLALLPPGNYTITYSMNGYLTRRMTTYITAAQITRGDIQLSPIEVQTMEVEIVATEIGRQQVDKTDTIVQTAFSQQKLIELTGGAGISNLLAFTPGVVGSSDFQIRGGTSRGSKIMIDGGNVTNMAEGTDYAVRYPMTDAVESVAVIQSPLNSRYGNTDGGLISFVQSKGSNEFKGTLRVIPSRTSIWNASGPNYPNNRGTASNFNPGNDNLGKTYQFYLSGPLVKNYVTFSWISQINPSNKYESYYYEALPYSATGIWHDNGTGNQIERYKVGTYYRNPSTGEVIRRAEMLEASDPMNTIGRSSVSKNDTFTLFYQVTQNHQLEWSYFEATGDNINNLNYYLADLNTNPLLSDTGWGGQRRWTLAYKGIIGANGLLEARMSRSSQSWYNVQSDGRPKHSVRVATMPSLNPINGIHNGDPSNYLASGFIDANLARLDGIKDSTNGGLGFYNFNASNEGPGDTATNDPININYQHILQTSHGQHIIDVGFQREKSTWVNPNLYGSGSVNAERLIYVPGRIALDLGVGDIYNYAGTNISDYAGKFIVWNMNHATFRSIDPYGFSRFNTGGFSNEPIDPDMRLLDWNNGSGWGTNLWPRMYEQSGGMYSDIYVQQTSYYINDLWSINDHHSVMAGVRFDNYKAWETASGLDIYSYSLPTFRFEYKWDIHGDQRRVFNLSYGQFHNMAPASSWGAFVDRNIREMIWTDGPTDGSPYLVGFDDIMNINKYTTINENVSGGVNEVDSNFKGLISNELTAGIRLNLDNGGFIRATFVQRTWDNEYAYTYNGWKPSPYTGNMVYSRLLKNYDFVERSYKSLELEWDVPLTKRVDFGGAYTYSRMLWNGLDETNSPQKSANKNVYYWEELNQFDYPHWGWMPVRLRDPEHNIRAYINYDLTYGKVKSNAAFRFSYTSASPATRSYGYEMGYPIVPGLNDHISGVNLPNPMPANTGLASTRTVFYNIHRTGGPDNWSTNLVYNLEVPVTNRVNWFVTITCGNPFNHRGKGTGWYSIDGWVGSGNIVPETIYRPDGTVYRAANNPYAIGGMKSDNVQRNNANLFAPNQIQGGRTIGLQTGIRF